MSNIVCCSGVQSIRAALTSAGDSPCDVARPTLDRSERLGVRIDNASIGILLVYRVSLLLNLTTAPVALGFGGFLSRCQVYLSRLLSGWWSV